MNTDFISGPYGSRLREIVGELHFQEVVESFSQPKSTSFRVNTLKSTVDSAAERLQADGLKLRAVPWCDLAFSVADDQRSELTHSNLCSNGEIYVQGLSSIFATTVLQPQPDQWNLDLASAPGGKASHIACLMQNRGKLSVVEPIKRRMYRLADNLKRLGVTISRTYLMDGRKVGRKVPDRFDCIMLDAPCSSDSRIRLDEPETWEYWSERKVREQARKQKGLIVSAFEALKPGGTLLYCTCSFSPEENEAIVTHLVEKSEGRATAHPIEMPFENWQPGLRLFHDTEFDESVQHSRRILPNKDYDAFFMAKFTKA